MKIKDLDQLGIKSYMAIGLIAYLVVSTLMFVALMVLDSVSASELAMQNVIATIVQATLAAAALFGVSIAVLYVAKNTDISTERQALAHELAAETASLNRIEKYLIEVITPLWNIKNAINDMFVFAKAESTRLSGFCVLDVEDARILQLAIKVSEEDKIYNEEYHKYFDIHIISSILSGGKKMAFGLDRNKILDDAYSAYKKEPDRFYREMQSYDSKKRDQSAICQHYDYVNTVDKEKENKFIELVNNGDMEKPHAVKSYKVEEYNDISIIILSWYFLENAGIKVRKRLDFLDIVCRNEQFCLLINPSDTQSGQAGIKSRKPFKLQDDGTVSAEQRAWWRTEAEFENDVEKGFTGEMEEWEILRDTKAINKLFTEIYCDKVINIGVEDYLEKTLARLNNLSHIMNEAIKLLNENVLPASYVTTCLKMIYKETERKFTPSSIETAVSDNSLQIDMFLKNIINEDRYAALSDIQKNGLIECHGKLFVRLCLAFVNVIPYVILDLVKPIEIENNKREELFKKGKKKHIKETTRSPLVDSLKLQGFIHRELNYTEIKPLDSIQADLDTSIFAMSQEFWELAKEWCEINAPL